ncbi:hypothetical protein LX64_04238 [Chitinophaga skermanii]|uniref:PepSY-like beta-lactamase-inhibitor n=1 Tax=Chitinophaga skermanii TaxID=331697 RepID=A0A327Q749_9BACT|nr:hypothetical protein [Chitinophaga skermanii]RAI99693.1 hypothetical protein LX64_04238 [Chitinophaga skermanii]
MKNIITFIAFICIATVAAANNKKINIAKVATTNTEKVAVKKVRQFFAENGTLLATSRFISDVELPQAAIETLILKCPNENIKAVQEINKQGSKYYIITLETESRVNVVRVDADGSYRAMESFQKS